MTEGHQGDLEHSEEMGERAAGVAADCDPVGDEEGGGELEAGAEWGLRLDGFKSDCKRHEAHICLVCPSPSTAIVAECEHRAGLILQ